MGYHNPPIPWARLEGILSGHQRPDGGDGPAWSRKREPFRAAPPPAPEPGDVVPYAELHCHSSFSFLDGASGPEALAQEATRLGLSALALTDHDGFYGIVRFAEAAEALGLPTVFGAELSLGLRAPQNGVPDPEGEHLLVLARGQEGYHRLSAALTEAHLGGGEKGRPRYDLDDLATHAGGHWHVLTGCRKGAVRRALATHGPDGRPLGVTETERMARGGAALDELVGRFGADRVTVELVDHGHPTDTTTNDLLAGLAAARGLPLVATNNVHYATPEERRLASAVAAVRARGSLDDLDPWLPASGLAHLRSGVEMAARFARYPGAVERSVELARECAFALRAAAPRLPRQEVPEGHTPMSWLRELTWRGAAVVYDDTEEVRSRLSRELDVIEEKDFPGYFLIVHDLVHYAKERGILCQGRGSAANSAVCYVLGITAVDSIGYGLPFERFLATTRDEEPDIDVDFDSNRREEVIQYVYQKYGRRNAAQVANVITYRPKAAVRDMAKALGHSSGQQDAWSKLVDGWASTIPEEVPRPVLELASVLLNAPRHLGIHSGGMVLTERPVAEVVPIEPARMEDRTVVQWDKDDCAWMGLVKFDLLGLGMLGAIQHTLDLAADTVGERWTLTTMPKEEPGVYDMLCRADSIGVFQVESRAQIGTLPRLQPRRFYDLVCEIALIRPGPIQGESVHPFIRRKTGKEAITYPHPKLIPVLERTLGVPLFQEQLMQMAMAIGGLSGDDADLLRRAMGSKRGLEKIGSLRQKLYDGMLANGLSEDEAGVIYAKIEAFAHFGFAESHSLSFALLVYSSTWLRLHYPGAFLCGLLRTQPMGFYSPQTLVGDARRHGVEVRRPCIQRSGATAGLEPLGGAEVAGATGSDDCVEATQPPAGDFSPKTDAFDPDTHRRDGHWAVRLGLTEVKGVDEATAEAVVAARPPGGYADLADLSRRVRLGVTQWDALATAGAFEAFGLSVREALWASGIAATESPSTLPGVSGPTVAPTLPGMSPMEVTASDLAATGISPDTSPMEHVRPVLAAAGVLRVGDLGPAYADQRVRVAGVVTHRQRPATASGITFLNLEDETGLANVVCTPGLWARYRRTLRNAPALVVRGVLQVSEEGVVNVQADHVERLRLNATVRSRDFR